MKKIIETDYGGGIKTLEHFFSSEECKHWIDFSEKEGYEKAGVNIGGQQKVISRIRNNQRVILDDEKLGIELWAKLKTYAVINHGITTAVGLNERFRFYKYLPGHRFKKHQDGSFIRNIHEWSSFTFMVYLNEEMEGGATSFGSKIQVKPKTGMALIFPHEYVHEGQEVTEGVKYVLRTDIMYRRKGY